MQPLRDGASRKPKPKVSHNQTSQIGERLVRDRPKEELGAAAFVVLYAGWGSVNTEALIVTHMRFATRKRPRYEGGPRMR